MVEQKAMCRLCSRAYKVGILTESLLIDLAMTLSSRCSGVGSAWTCPFEAPPGARKAAAATPPVVSTSRRENLFMGRHSLVGDESPRFSPVFSNNELRQSPNGPGRWTVRAGLRRE